MCVCVCVCVCVCARACALMLEDVVGGDWETGRVDREMENIILNISLTYQLIRHTFTKSFQNETLRVLRIS